MFECFMNKSHKKWSARYLTLLSFSCSGVFASPSFTGGTGVLSTPNAEVAPEGVFTYQYNTYGEPHLSNNYDKTQNHIINLGVTPKVEISGRLTDYVPEGNNINANGTKRGKRDLSGNIKIQLPEIADDLPKFAIGANDIAGEAVNFQSQYIVATQKIDNFKASLGYAAGDNQSFKGKFGSVEYQASPNLVFAAEYDSQNYQVGASYDASHLIGLPVTLKASRVVKSKSEDKGTYLAVSYSQDLKRKFINQKKTLKKYRDSTPSIKHFIEKLARTYQLESIQLGRMNGGLVIAIENYIYNHNILDMLAIVYGTASELLPVQEKNLTVVIKHNGIAKVVTKASLPALRKFFLSNETNSSSKLQRSWKSWYPSKQWLSSIQWEKKNYGAAKTRLDIRVQPHLRTAVGTEWGTFDYSAAVRTDVNLNLWKGAKLSSSWDAPVKTTPIYEEGVYAHLKHDSGLQQIALHQEFKPSRNSLALASLGQVKVNNQKYKVAQVEGGISDQKGKRHISGKVARYQDQEKSNRDLAIASYRHDWATQDISTTISYGKFFEQDKGVRFQLDKDFGSAQVNAYIKYIDRKDISGGMQLAIPLTPKRDYKKSGVVVRGSEHWVYGQETTIKDPVVVGSNRIRNNMMLNPQLQYNFEAQTMLKRRLSPQYLNNHLEDLKKIYYSLDK